jgi:hypothetical protein
MKWCVWFVLVLLLELVLDPKVCAGSGDTEKLKTGN